LAHVGTGEAGTAADKIFGGGELARAYVPAQIYTGRLDPAEGWKDGTIFSELIRPYAPASRRGRRRR
jgi:hypothetical protein